MEEDAISHFINSEDFSNELYRVSDGVFSFHHYVWNEIAIIEDDYILIKYTSYSYHTNVILKILKCLKRLKSTKKVAFVSHLFDNYITENEYNIFFKTLSIRLVEKFSEQGFNIFDYVFNSVFLPNRSESAYPIFLKQISDIKEGKNYESHYKEIDSYILSIERKVKIEHLTR